ncbi:MAG: AraC family transcriptional regulator [Weeksellaceae bacterium]|nr:AraC family transcriptional regulator [Weeksellaceae bacterium]
MLSQPYKHLKFIRKYYKPIQPSISENETEIIYNEIKPSPELDNFIYCFWQLKTKKTLQQDFVYRVVSDGCIDIFFECKKPEENFVMGFCRKYTEFPIGKEFNYIGIRFLPSAFPLIFGINAKQLSNQSQELKLILPEFSKWIYKNIKPTETFNNVSKILDEKLNQLIISQDINIDNRFFYALQLIFEKNGFLDTEKDLQTGLSSRHLQRIFNFYIGTTAKTFSNVVRFQHILNAKPSKQSLKENKFYFDIGFYDQAHFVKNFKTFYGVTPSEAFR